MFTTPFIYKELDLLKSIRHYFMHEVIDQDAEGNLLTLRDRFPTMASDVLQGGIRYGDLYDEEALPCYPALGISIHGLLGVARGFLFRAYRYPLFVEASCKVLVEGSSAVDPEATLVQQMEMLAALRYLLIEGRARNVPLYIFDPAGGTDCVGTFAISPTPSPRITKNPSRAEAVLSLSADAVVELVLSKV